MSPAHKTTVMPKPYVNIRPKPSIETPEVAMSEEAECSAGSSPSICSATAPEAWSPSLTAPEALGDQNSTTQWPSQVTQRSSCAWLLPPYQDQSSSIILLLRAEVESHNITREMLHATEQRRLEAVQRCEQLLSDSKGWAAAYNSLMVVVQNCSAEYARLSSEHAALKVRLETHNFQVLARQLPPARMLTTTGESPSRLCSSAKKSG